MEIQVQTESQRTNVNKEIDLSRLKTEVESSLNWNWKWDNSAVCTVEEDWEFFLLSEKDFSPWEQVLTDPMV